MEIYFSLGAGLISLFSLVIGTANFWRFRKTSLASIYPKVTGKLILQYDKALPVYEILNESDKLTARNLKIEVSIKKRLRFSLCNRKRFIYQIELEKLDPQENFPPSKLIGEQIIEWLKNHGYVNKSLSIKESLRKRKLDFSISNLSETKIYRVQLTITYTSSNFNENKICRFHKNYKLLSFTNTQSTVSRDTHYWKLVE